MKMKKLSLENLPKCSTTPIYLHPVQSKMTILPNNLAHTSPCPVLLWSWQWAPISVISRPGWTTGQAHTTPCLMPLAFHYDFVLYWMLAPSPNLSMSPLCASLIIRVIITEFKLVCFQTFIFLHCLLLVPAKFVWKTENTKTRLKLKLYKKRFTTCLFLFQQKKEIPVIFNISCDAM